MKATERKIGQFVTGVVASLVLLPCLLAAQATGNDSARLSKKELKTLLATGNNTSDQARLAAYYRDKARELNAKSEQFAAQADALAKEPATIESKQGIGCNSVSHYRYFSKLYAREAQESETLAARHDQTAKEYLAKQQQ